MADPDIIEYGETRAGWPILKATMTDAEIFDAMNSELVSAKMSVGQSGKGFLALDNAQTLLAKLRHQQTARAKEHHARLPLVAV